ncbi:MAG: kelch repeat-containing protein, partial [candidate division WOR-3 bacterium]
MSAVSSGSPDDDFGAPEVNIVEGKSTPTDHLNWRQRASLSEGISRTAGVFDPAGRFHLICGNCNSHVAHPYDEVWNPTTNTWSRGLTHPGSGVYNHDAVRLDNVIYVGGGSQGSGNFYNRLTTIDLTTNTWTSRTSMPLNSFLYYSLAAAGGQIYCLGGYNQVAVLATVYRYNPTTNAWSARAPMPEPRRNCLVAVVGDTIHVFGGMARNDIASTTNTHWKYSLSTNAWTVGTPLPGTLGWGRAVVVTDPDSGAFIYCLGGVSNGAIVNTVYRYAQRYDTWLIETPLLSATRSHAAGAQGDRMFVAGGYNQGMLALAEEVVFRRPDAAVIRIEAPAGRVPVGSVVAPRALIRNNGNLEETFSVRFTISDGYEHTRTVTLA